MSKRDKLLSKLADSRQDWKNNYEEVTRLLINLGLKVRSKGGSHVKFIVEGMSRPLVLTEDKKGMITHYQSRQVREELQRRGII